MASYPFNFTSTDFPLSNTPFNSRVELSEVTGTPNKNYSMVAFRPGFPLQASELNEIQDLFFLNQTLTTTMFNLWMTTDSTTTSFPAPGWYGTTPLWPEKFLTDEMGPVTNLCYYEQVNATTVKVTANSGWYYVHMKKSGLKHWYYLSTKLVSENITIGPSSTYIGMNFTYQTVNSTLDPSLNDNSGNNSTPGSPAGASRIKINIESNANLVTQSDLLTNMDFSPIFKISSLSTPNVLYMNNRPVPLETTTG